MKNIGEGETVLLRQCNVESVVGCGCLQLKIEAAAETLAQRQSPSFVDAGAEWSVDDQLHAAAFIEEALGNNCALCGNSSEDGASFKNVLNGLRGAGFIQPTLFV